MSDYWTESFDDASPLEREREEADLRDWEAEQARDRQIRFEHPMDKMISNEDRRKALEPRYAAAVRKFYGKETR